MRGNLRGLGLTLIGQIRRRNVFATVRAVARTKHVTNTSEGSLKVALVNYTELVPPVGGGGALGIDMLG